MRVRGAVDLKILGWVLLALALLAAIYFGIISKIIPTSDPVINGTIGLINNSFG